MKDAFNILLMFLMIVAIYGAFRAYRENKKAQKDLLISQHRLAVSRRLAKLMRRAINGTSN